MKHDWHQGLNISGYGPGPTAGADMKYTGKQALLFGGIGGIALDHNT